jgi:hypothetical protein
MSENRPYVAGGRAAKLAAGDLGRFWVLCGSAQRRFGPPTAGRVKGMLAFARRLLAPLDAILVGGGVAPAPRCQGIATRDVLQQSRSAAFYHREPG